MAWICDERTDKELCLSEATPGDSNCPVAKSGESLFLATGAHSCCPVGWWKWSRSSRPTQWPYPRPPKAEQTKNQKRSLMCWFQKGFTDVNKLDFQEMPDCVLQLLLLSRYRRLDGFPDHLLRLTVLLKSPMNVISGFFRNGNRIDLVFPCPSSSPVLVVWLEDGVKGLMVQAPLTPCSSCYVSEETWVLGMFQVSFFSRSVTWPENGMRAFPLVW